MEILAVFNAKGGVGKTTTAVNLSACLAATGLRVAMIDLDSQGNATSNIGLSAPPDHGTFEVIGGQVPIADALVPTFMESLSVIGATRTLSASDLDLAAGKTEHGIIRAVSRPIADQIDVIVLDCPPTFGTMTTNALLSADAVIIPSQPSPFAHDGLVRTWTVLKRVRTKLNRELKILGVLPTFVSEAGGPGAEADQAVLDAMIAEFGDMVHPTGIPADPALFARATADGLPAVVEKPDAPASIAYLTIALRLRSAGETHEAGETPRLLGRLAGSQPPSEERLGEALKMLARWRSKAVADGQLDSGVNVPSVDYDTIERQTAVEREHANKAAGIDPLRPETAPDGGQATLILSVLGAGMMAGVVGFAAGWYLAGGGILP